MLAAWTRRFPPAPNRRPKTRRPLLLSLEDRCVPAAFALGGPASDRAAAVAADAAGNLYVAGTFSGTVDFDPGPGVSTLTSGGTSTDDSYLARYTAAGALAWVGRLVDTTAEALAVDAAGAVYVTGNFPGTTDFDLGTGVSNLQTGQYVSAYVAKYNPDRTLGWAAKFGSGPGTGNAAGGAWGLALTLDAGGNIYAAGSFSLTTVDMDPGPGVFHLNNTNAGGNSATYVAKLTPAGGFVWAKPFYIDPVGAHGVWAADLGVDAAQNVYVTGVFGGNIDFDNNATTTWTSTNPSDPGGDGYVVKLDSQGNFVHLVRVGSVAGRDDGTGILVDPDGTAYVSGFVRGNATVDATAGDTSFPGAGIFDAYVLRLTPTGALDWVRPFTGTGLDTAWDIASDGGTGLYVSGYYAAGVDFDPGAGTHVLPYAGGGYDAYVLQLRKDGTFVNAWGFGGTGAELAEDIIALPGGQYAVAGHFQNTVDFDPGPGVANLTSSGPFDGFVAVLPGGGTGPVNQPPVASNGTLTIDEGTAATGTLVANDPDGGSLTFGLVDVSNAHGTVTITDSATGAYSYTPDPDYSGPASFTFKASDGLADSNVATISITVNPVNDAPTATSGSGSTAEDTALTGTLAATDPDGDDLTFSVVDGPTHGALTAFDPDTGAFTYTPAADYSGADSFTFKVNDGTVDSNTAAFGITVTAANDPPTVDPVPDPDAIPEDAGQQTVTLTGLSAGPADEAGQTLTVTATSSRPEVVPHPTRTYSGGDTATLTYAPLPNVSGTVTITVTVSDGIDTTVETFLVVVGSEPDRPVIDTTFTPLLPPIKMPLPRGTSPAGGPIATLVAHVTDADPDDPRGVAITGADTANGKWEYSTDAGHTWTPLPAVTPSSALLLADDGQTQVRFLPNKRAPRVKPFTRGFAGFTYTPWDGSNDGDPGTQADTTAVSDTAYSLQTEWAWVAVGKTTPTLDAQGRPVLRAIREDARQSPAYAVKTFLGLLAKETDPTRVFGVALSGTVGTGTWEFNTGKGGWQPLGSVSDGSAVLLRPTDRVRFRPGRDFNGEAHLVYHTWDMAAGAAGDRVDVTAVGGFSAATEAAVLNVLPVNDAPVLDTAPDVSLGTVPLFGTVATTVADLRSGAATDVETPTAGIGIQVLGGTGGTWEYSADGVLWTKVTRPVYLGPAVQIRFMATTFGVTTASLRYRAWDGTAPKPTSVSRAVETVSVTVTGL